MNEQEELFMEFWSVFSDAVGIVGVFLLLVAYYLLSAGKWSAQTLKYQLFNFFGAGCILFSLFFHWNTSAVIIEIAWMMIGVVGMYRIWRART